ncbi:MAG TPA: hypothetical protein VM846_03570 [Vicinamibacterales bacterium]|jgi:hypothetical protein|nr:hypothetical protein [Vicinamibacterales bacterium]
MTSRWVRLKPDITLTDALRDGDPITYEGGMVEAEAGRMKRTIAAAAGDVPARPLIVHAALAAIPIAIALVLGSTLREAVMAPVPARPAISASAAGDATAARQLYFETAGGTRVIWIFTPDEEEK